MTRWKALQPSPRLRGWTARSRWPLANLVKQDIGQLTALVKTRLRRMQYQPGLLGGFLDKTRLDFTPLQ